MQSKPPDPTSGEDKLAQSDDPRTPQGTSLVTPSSVTPGRAKKTPSTNYKIIKKQGWTNGNLLLVMDDYKKFSDKKINPDLVRMMNKKMKRRPSRLPRFLVSLSGHTTQSFPFSC